MPGQRATACRPPGRGERGPLGRPRPCARSRPWLALLAPLLAFAPPALAGPEDLPPWQPEASSAAPDHAAPAPAPAASSSSAAPDAPDAPPDLAAAAATPSTPPAPSRAPASAADPDLPDLPPVPIDPNDAPFLRAPNNQIQTTPPRTRPDLRRGWSSRRRLAFTLAPAFASTRLPFQGRLLSGNRAPRNHGGGVNLELDVQIWRWIWLRAQGTYSGHPVDEARVEQPDKSFLITAPPGTIHIAGFGGGPIFALDLGRFLPLIEVGLGGLRVATPAGGTIAGLRGESCRSDGSCDVGLRCTAARTCEPTIMPELYFGGAVDLLVRRHFSFGAQFRYYARLTNPGQFPLYLLGTLRISVRF